jgi:biotin transporter BioY
MPKTPAVGALAPLPGDIAKMIAAALICLKVRDQRKL